MKNFEKDINTFLFKTLGEGCKFTGCSYDTLNQNPQQKNIQKVWREEKFPIFFFCYRDIDIYRRQYKAEGKPVNLYEITAKDEIF